MREKGLGLLQNYRVPANCTANAIATLVSERVYLCRDGVVVVVEEEKEEKEEID